MNEIIPDTKTDYLKERLTKLGLSVEDLTVRGRGIGQDVSSSEYQLLTSDEAGNIVFNYPTLSGDLDSYKKNGKEKNYYRLRYAPQNVKDRKYYTPYGANTKIFFPPTIIKNHQSKAEINTLFVVEGEFKALAGSKNGLSIVGIQGIHNFLQKGEQGNKILNPSLESLVKDCRVKNLVLLFDGDCLSVEYEDENKDLHKRLNSFYTAVRNFREFTKHLDIDVYFSHLKPELEAKGLDDLYCLNPKQSNKITADIKSLILSKDFFICQNITDKSLGKLLDYFNIRNEHAFHEAYSEIIEQKPFTFKGTKYQYNGKALDILSISEAKNYVRIGDDYFEKVEMPDKDGKTYPALLNRKKGTILDDYKSKASNILQMIKKYKGFCNTPNNINFQEEVSGFYNLYQATTNKPDKGDIEQSLKFVKHIFGDQYELGLDYLQLLYTKPTQVLPIVCLVSKEQETGKTTFAEWLRYLFGNNVTSITSQDLEGQFNDNYATRLVVYVDETFIDKKQVKERIKNLSTASRITVNAKNQAKQEVQFFGKFILCSNNETDFINLENTDVRFWVRKIERIKDRDPDFKNSLKEEVPAFLYYLQNREMSIKKAKTRMWFDISDIQTEALNYVIAESKGFVYKEIRSLITEYFLAFRTKEIKLTNHDIWTHLNSKNIKVTSHQLGKILKEELDMEPNPYSATYEYLNLYNSTVQPVTQRGRYYTFKIEDFLSEEQLKNI